jgi:hypothetical protein
MGVRVHEALNLDGGVPARGPLPSGTMWQEMSRTALAGQKLRLPSPSADAPPIRTRCALQGEVIDVDVHGGQSANFETGFGAGCRRPSDDDVVVALAPTQTAHTPSALPPELRRQPSTVHVAKPVSALVGR